METAEKDLLMLFHYVATKKKKKKKKALLLELCRRNIIKYSINKVSFTIHIY